MCVQKETVGTFHYLHTHTRHASHTRQKYLVHPALGLRTFADGKRTAMYKVGLGARQEDTRGKVGRTVGSGSHARGRGQVVPPQPDRSFKPV